MLGDAEATVGAVEGGASLFTVKHPLHVPVAPLGLVTLTSRAPGSAPVAMVTLATTVFGLWKVVEFTVIPPPEKEAVAPATKLVPVIVTSWRTEPRGRELGFVEATVGVWAVATLKQPAHDPVAPPGLVTVTSRVPAAAPGVTVTLTVKTLLLWKVVELTVIPPPEKAAVAPGRKLAPEMVTSRLVEPWGSELGLVDVTVGGWAVDAAGVTVKHPVHDPAGPPGFVTVTVRGPSWASLATVTLASSVVLDWNAVEFTVTPPPVNEAEAPGAKLAPEMVTSRLVEPWGSELGLVEETVGPGVEAAAPR